MSWNKKHDIGLPMGGGCEMDVGAQTKLPHFYDDHGKGRDRGLHAASSLFLTENQAGCIYQLANIAYLTSRIFRGFYFELYRRHGHAKNRRRFVTLLLKRLEIIRAQFN